MECMIYVGGSLRLYEKSIREILMYDGNEDKWTKVGDLCRGRANHAMSLVPAALEDECIVDIDCFDE